MLPTLGTCLIERKAVQCRYNTANFIDNVLGDVALGIATVALQFIPGAGKYRCRRRGRRCRGRRRRGRCCRGRRRRRRRSGKQRFDCFCI